MKGPMVGERVALYDGGGRNICVIIDTLVVGNGIVRVRKIHGLEFNVHVNQLRRLIKKRKLREWWICKGRIEKDKAPEPAELLGPYGWNFWFNEPHGSYIRTTPPDPRATVEWIHVREVRERK